MSSRVRGHTGHTALLLALATCLWTSCIFSPPTGVIPPEPPPIIDSPAAVVSALSRAYQTRDLALFTSLLANDKARGAEYLFLLSAPTDIGETQWGFQEESRIHQRMFKPESPPPGDPPVASELWLQSVTITLTPKESFAERPDLYTTNGGSLDPAIWRAKDASYTTYVFFDLAGTDYKVEGEANFIVIEDLTKVVGDTGKFLLYIWEDINTGTGGGKPTATPS